MNETKIGINEDNPQGFIKVLPITKATVKKLFNDVWLIAILSVYFIYFIVTSQQLGQPYVIDEAAFPYAANGILSGGAPYFYNGETRPMDLGMWHPPLYVYSLAAFILVFGFTIESVRFFGVLIVFLSYLIGVLTLEKINDKNKKASLLIFTFLFLLSPLMIAGSLVPDIDGTFGVLLMSLTLFVSVKVFKEETKSFFKYFLVLFIVAWLTKITLTLIFFIILLLAVILKKGKKIKILIELCFATFTGLAISLIGMFILSRMAGFPFSAPFNYFLSGLSRTSSDVPILRKIYTNLMVDNTILFWVTPSLVIASLLCLLILLISRIDLEDKRIHIFLFLTFGFIIILYAAITGPVFTFPKYWGISLIPLYLLLASAKFHFELLPFKDLKIQPAKKYLYISTIISGLIIFLLVRSYSWLNSEISEGIRSYKSQINLMIYLIPIIFISTVILLYLHKQKMILSLHNIKKILVTSFVILAILIQTSLSLILRTSEYSTRYYFSEQGMEELLQYIQINTDINSTLISAKDIGIQSGRKFHEDAAYLFLPIEQFESKLLEVDADYLVTREKWDYSESSFPEHFTILSNYYVQESIQPSKDFTLWVRNSK